MELLCSGGLFLVVIVLSGFDFCNFSLNLGHEFSDRQFIALAYCNTSKIISFDIDKGQDIKVFDRDSPTKDDLHKFLIASHECHAKRFESDMGVCYLDAFFCLLLDEYIGLMILSYLSKVNFDFAIAVRIGRRIPGCHADFRSVGLESRVTQHVAHCVVNYEERQPNV